jgi:Mg2+ and Co2+ transporter CorA
MKRKKINWTLPPAIEDRLGENSYGRQRAIFEDDHLLIILHLPPAVGTIERESSLYLRNPDGALFANGVKGGDFHLRKLLADYRARWEECDKLYDMAESAEDLFQLLEKVAPLNRASTNMANALQAARDYVKEDKFLISMRDESYEISRAFELLLNDAKLKLDYRIAKNAEVHAAIADQTAAAQNKLNIMAAMTFPIMALATVLGMNLTSGLEDRSPLLFIGILTTGVIMGLLVKRWVTRVQ